MTTLLLMGLYIPIKLSMVVTVDKNRSIKFYHIFQLKTEISDSQNIHLNSLKVEKMQEFLYLMHFMPSEYCFQKFIDGLGYMYILLGILSSARIMCSRIKTEIFLHIDSW